MRFLVSLSLLVLFAACGGGTSGPAGKWTLDTAPLIATMKSKMAEELKGKSEEEKKMAEQFAGPMVEMLKKMKGELTLAADGTCQGDFDSPDGKKQSKGTWKANGDQITVVTTETGKTAAETKVGALKGDELSFTEPDADPKMQMTMVFRRTK